MSSTSQQSRVPEVSSILALGSNLGNRHQTLNSAISEIAVHPHISLHNVSPIIISEPVGYSQDGTTIDVSSQPHYLNMVIEIGTSLSAKKLLETLQTIENSHERERHRRWDARTLDIDIITYGNAQSNQAELTLPHPRATERAFVLYPWALMDKHAVINHHSTSTKIQHLLPQTTDISSVRILPDDFNDEFIEQEQPKTHKLE